MVNMKPIQEKMKSQGIAKQSWYERNKEYVQKKQREYEANKRIEVKEKLERLEFLEEYIQEQGLAI